MKVIARRCSDAEDVSKIAASSFCFSKLENGAPVVVSGAIAPPKVLLKN